MRRTPFVICLLAAALIGVPGAQAQTLSCQSQSEPAPDHVRSHALRVVFAEIIPGQIQVVGIQAASNADITWEGGIVTRANPGGTFRFSTTDLPASRDMELLGSRNPRAQRCRRTCRVGPLNRSQT
jgi:hypothetical protein